MKGSYRIQVANSRVQFKFTLQRNITVLRGDSARGKTTLIDMIADHAANGPASGISLSSPKRCVVLQGGNWERDLAETSDSFVFIDEGNPFIRSHDFARAARESDNYYVIASREPLPTLPYSVDEIYEIRNSTRTHYPPVKRMYSSFRRIYGGPPEAFGKPNLVIVEDSNSCFDFFSALCARSGIRCVSAGGKAGVFHKLDEAEGDGVLVIADGAAFGPEMELVSALARQKGAALFLPESFEWLLLSSGIVKDADIPEILADPASYIESREYFSWERFFTNLLVERTAGTYLAYRKASLNASYLGEQALEKALAQIPVPFGE